MRMYGQSHTEVAEAEGRVVAGAGEEGVPRVQCNLVTSVLDNIDFLAQIVGSFPMSCQMDSDQIGPLARRLGMDFEAV